MMKAETEIKMPLDNNMYRFVCLRSLYSLLHKFNDVVQNYASFLFSYF